MAEDIEGLQRLLNRIEQLATDTRQVSRPLEAAGQIIIASVEQNFQEQGRPQKWNPLSPRTLAGRRGRGGKGRYGKSVALSTDSSGRLLGGARILIDTARLKNSLATRVQLGLPDSYVEVGTKVVYAARHHFGYAGGQGRGRSKTRARPFLLVQPEDIRDIGQIFRRHLRRR